MNSKILKIIEEDVTIEFICCKSGLFIEMHTNINNSKINIIINNCDTKELLKYLSENKKTNEFT